jgi:hypothetical protein
MSAILVLILRILIAVSLYAFTGYAFYLLWKTLRPAAGGRKTTTPWLTLKHSDKPDQEALQFEPGEVLVGRLKTCGLCLQDKTVSSRHALLSYHYKQWWVEDLGSTNGTYLNTMPVATPTVLVKGDILTIGKFNLVVGFESI